jgi:putative spermidine/putrescine transport system ATP-binding protein
MPEAKAFLDIRRATKTFGGAFVLDGVDLSVDRGEFVSLLGPSGCGKTTLLRITAGLMAATSGEIRLDGEEISRKPPHHRDVGVVFQSYALFPHLTVAENVAFGLEAKGWKKSEIGETVSRFLALVHMSDFAGRSVRALSGGQQQRVAVARALAVQPKLLLLDEPFSALDRKLRETMQIELKRLLKELGTTAIFVTHDQDEALIMSDRIAVMNRGRIEQYASPDVIYNRPATPFALDFVGLSMRISGTVAERLPAGHLRIDTARGLITAKPGAGETGFAVGSAVVVGARPERVTIDGIGDNRISATITDTVFQGARTQVHFAAAEPDRLLVEVPAGSSLRPGQTAELSWKIADTLVFVAEAME